MKIGIDARLWSQKGIGRYIRNLVYNLHLIDKKNNYVLFVRTEDRKKIGDLSNNFKVVEANIPWHSLKEQLNFPKILIREKLDIMHFTYSSLPVFYNNPFVLTIHDLTPFHFTTGRVSTKPLIYNFKKLGYRFIISKAAKDAKEIIVPSNFTRKEIVEHLKINPNKVKVIYEGVEVSQISQRRLISGEYFLYVGNAYPHKNLDYLIKAFLQLNTKKIKLVLVGKDDYFYKRLRRDFNSSNIIFYGEAKEDELTSLYKNAKAYIMPSLMEGFGLTGLEAMANGCLVLASDIPVHREIYTDVAIYFNPKDSEDLINKIRNLDKFESKKEEGLSHVKRFSWKKTAEQTLRIYQQTT